MPDKDVRPSMQMPSSDQVGLALWAGEWIAYAGHLEALLQQAVDALPEVAEGRGSFSMDQATFANNVIENAKEIANTILAAAAEAGIKPKGE